MSAAQSFQKPSPTCSLSCILIPLRHNHMSLQAQHIYLLMPDALYAPVPLKLYQAYLSRTHDPFEISLLAIMEPVHCPPCNFLRVHWSVGLIHNPVLNQDSRHRTATREREIKDQLFLNFLIPEFHSLSFECDYFYDGLGCWVSRTT